jgi:predicted transcriptional regulator
MTDFPISDSLAALLERQRSARAANRCPKPEGYQRPAYGTAPYMADYRAGWISWDEWEADERASISRRARAKASYGTIGAYPARWHRPEPQDSRQYANQMATTAARDDRLTPQAKALLQVIRARCGRGQTTTTSKTTLAAVMSRHARSIQRYIAELVRFGYIETTTRRGESGLYTGLIVRITEKVAPFYAKAEALAEWLWTTTQDTAADLFHGISDRTRLSPKNDSLLKPISYGPSRGQRKAEFTG